MTIETRFAKFLGELVGLPISHIWRGHGSAIFFEIGSLTDSGFRKDGSKLNPVGEITLMVEWSWRVQNLHQILFGSWSDEHLWEAGFNSLHGKLISNCQLFGSLPEVVLSIETGLEFVSFSTTDGQPQWSFIDRRHENSTNYLVKDGRLQTE